MNNASLLAALGYHVVDVGEAFSVWKRWSHGGKKKKKFCGLIAKKNVFKWASKRHELQLVKNVSEL